MKTGIRMAVAMVAAVSSGAMAAPFSVSSDDMHDGQALARKHWFAGFGGACPPAGDKPHRYRFTVWALDVPTLPVDAGTSGALVGYLLHSHALASVQLTAMAGR
ncbi:TPA: hypothetical protein L9V51_001364 [Klebsiella pneumoniae]|nr:hypothetical protein [Klebsiella pneumoniae]